MVVEEADHAAGVLPFTKTKSATEKPPWRPTAFGLRSIAMLCAAVSMCVCAVMSSYAQTQAIASTTPASVRQPDADVIIVEASYHKEAVNVDVDADVPDPALDEESDDSTADELGASGRRWEWVEPRVRRLLNADDDILAAHAQHQGEQQQDKSKSSSMRLRGTPAALPADLVASLVAAEPVLSLDVRAAAAATNFTADAIILGDPKIVLRDHVPVKFAYETRGLNVTLSEDVAVKDRPGVIPGTLTSVQFKPWALFLCLAVHTEHCFEDADFLRLERRRTRGKFTKLNWLARLESVLWSKNAMCNTTKAAGAWQPVLGFACWVLPAQAPALLEVLEDRARVGHEQSRGSWIAKPYKKGGGIGIFVVDSDAQMRRMLGPRRTEELVVQPYLVSPHLIEGRKWDLRTYVLVTSVTPATRAFMFDDGLVRLASGQYDPNARRGGARTAFLTNTSVNKRKVKDMALLAWPFDKLRETLGQEAYALLRERMRRAVAMLFVSAESAFAKQYAAMDETGAGFRCAGCLQLLGVDLMVDQQLFPRVVEVNGEPNMRLTGETDGHYDALKLALQNEVSTLAVQPVKRLAERTAARLAQLALPQESVAALQGDAVAVEYIMQLERETALAKRFQLVYPDVGACESEAREALWDDFLSTVLSVEGEVRDAGRRRQLHEVATAYACSIDASG